MDTEQYEQVLDLLRMRGYNTQPCYLRTCSQLTVHQFDEIIESYAGRSESLTLLLSGGCLAQAENLFHDPLVVNALHTLPVSLLDSPRRFFMLRRAGAVDAFWEVVRDALAVSRPHVLWFNLVRRPAREKEPFSLSSLSHLPSDSSRIFILDNIFSVLTVNIVLAIRKDDDLKWILEQTRPQIPSLPPHGTTVLPVHEMAAWNRLILQTTSTVIFYIEMKARNMRTRRKMNPNAVLPLRLCADYGLERELVAMSGTINQYANTEIHSPWLSMTLAVLQGLLARFPPSANSAIQSPLSPSSLFRSVVGRFEEFPDWRGDWMINVFRLYSVSNFDAILQCDMSWALTVFLTKRPTLSSIKTVWSLLTEKLTSHAILTVDMLTHEMAHYFDPLSMYSKLYMLLGDRKRLVPLDVRFERVIKARRDGGFFHSSAHTPCVLPVISTMDGSAVSQNAMTRALSALVEVLQEQSSLLFPVEKLSQPWKMDIGHMKRCVNIRHLIETLFVLLQCSDLFYFPQENSPCGRRVLQLSPLISPPLAFLLGATLGLGIVTCVCAPFVLDPAQFYAFFSNDDPPASVRVAVEKLDTMDQPARYLLNLIITTASWSDYANFVQNYLLRLEGLRVFERVPSLLDFGEPRAMFVYEECVHEFKRGFNQYFDTSEFTPEELHEIAFFGNKQEEF